MPGPSPTIARLRRSSRNRRQNARNDFDGQAGNVPGHGSSASQPCWRVTGGTRQHHAQVHLIR